MKCSVARAVLWPPDRPRLVGGMVEAARRHVQTCPSCQEYFVLESSLRAPHGGADAPGAPHAVRQRVVHALADETRPQSSRVGSRTKLRAVAVIAPLLIIASGLAALAVGRTSVPTASHDAPNVFVEDYLRRAVGEDQISTGDPAEVTRFLQRELGIRVEPIRGAGLVISGAEVCLLEGRLGAMIHYEHEGSRVTHYLVPTAGATRRPPALSRPDEGRHEMPVVMWATAGVEQALVGEVDDRHLLEIALGGSPGW